MPYARRLTRNVTRVFSRSRRAYTRPSYARRAPTRVTQRRRGHSVRVLRRIS